MMITLIIVQGIIFVLLIFMMQHFMKGHVSGAVGHLQKLNDELLKQQSDLRQKIAEAEKEYNQKKLQLEQEISTKQADVRKEVSKTLDEARNKAMQEREKLINEAIETREKIKQEIMAEMEQQAINYSRELVSEFISGDMRKIVNRQLISEVVAGLREINMENYQIQGVNATIVSSETLEEDARKDIRKVFKEKIKRDVEFKEELNPELIAGIIIRFGALEIDGSLTNRLKEAAVRHKKEATRRYQGTT